MDFFYPVSGTPVLLPDAVLAGYHNDSVFLKPAFWVVINFPNCYPISTLSWATGELYGKENPSTIQHDNNDFTEWIASLYHMNRHYDYCIIVMIWAQIVTLSQIGATCI